VQVGVLGPTTAQRGRAAIDLGTRKARAVVAALALGGGRAVSVDALVDLLWGEEPPAAVEASLQAYVAGLRRALEPDRPPRAPATVLVTTAPGYVLRLPEGALDAARFDLAVSTAHRRVAGLRAGDVAGLPVDDLLALAASLDGALGLWRGTPYLELGDAPAAVAERTRLEELRLVGVEDRARVRLALGEHATVAAELEPLVSQHPLREDLWALRAAALAGSGRQAEALAALRAVRRLLADELGIDPGPALRRVEQAVLRQDPALQGATAVAAVVAPPVEDASAAGPAGPRAEPDADEPRRRLPDQRDADEDRQGRPPADSPSGLVGRDGDLRRLEELLASAARGDTRAALVVGEPGIGKSALLDELGRRAAAGGWRVLVGRCSDDDGAPPLWPWREALPALLPLLPPGAPSPADRAALEPLLGAARTEAVTVPAQGGRAPAAQPAGEAARSARFVTWEAVARVLSAACATQPVLLVLDDLHWADASSLRLLRHVLQTVRTARLAVVVTRRAHPEPSGALADVGEALARLSAERLELGGLDQAQTTALATAASGRAPEPLTALAVHDRSEGNPFFVIELARLLTSPARAEDVPAAVSDVVRRRVQRLPDATQELLRWAAVVGRSFPVDVVAAVAGRDEEGVLDDLDPAIAAGVLLPDGVDLRFSHALVRDAIHGSLLPARLARRHAAVAERLEGLPGADSVRRRSEAARHWLAAGPARAGRAWRAAAVAAQLAMSVYAHEEAVELLRAAAAAHDQDGEAAPRHRYDLAMALAAACRAAADDRGVHAALAVARAAARSLGDVEVLARACLASTDGIVWTPRAYGEVDADAVASLREVLDQLPADDSELRCRALLVLAVELYYAADSLGERTALLQEGLAMARRLGDPALVQWACRVATIGDWRRAVTADRLALADEAVAAARQAQDEVGEALARTVRAIALLELGRVAEMRQEAERARAFAEQRRLAYPLAVLELMLIPWLAMSGRFDEAEARVPDLLALLERTNLPPGPAIVLGVVLPIRIWQGRGEELLEVVRAHNAPGNPLGSGALWFVLCRTGRVDELRALHEQLGVPEIPSDWAGPWMAAIAVEAADTLDLPELAARGYAELAPLAGQVLSSGSGAASGPVDAWLALAAATVGDRSMAARHADDALELCRRWEIPVVAEWVLVSRRRGEY
jgi:DNA-binding SARP family transcriptional activator